jgi:hypothetical protein
MSDAGRDLLVRGIAAAKANSIDEARFFLEKCLRVQPTFEIRVQAWRYLAQIAADTEEKRDYLSMILGVDPTDGLARRDLAILNGTLDPRDVVNPEAPAKLPRNEGGPGRQDGEEEQTAERLACPQCGAARMFYSPDGQALVCDHCQHREPVRRSASQSYDDSVDDHDFATTMWTAKARRAPESTPSFTCGGCGGTFLLAPGVLSWNCPYCRATHVESRPESRDLIPPEAVIVFAVAAHEASDALSRWQRDETPLDGLSEPAGLYLPVWSFSFGGSVRWSGLEQEPFDIESKHPARVSGDLTILERHAFVCATEPLPPALQPLLDDFDRSKLVPYNPRLLSDRPAETYRLTLDEATLHARRLVIAGIKASSSEELPGIRNVEMSFTRLGVDSFKLLLLPFWIARFGPADARRLAMVNGQTGRVAADAESGGFLASLSRLLGGS